MLLPLVQAGGSTQSNTKIQCKVRYEDNTLEYFLTDLAAEYITGRWTTAAAIQAADKHAHLASNVVSNKDVFLLESAPIELTRACYRQFAQQFAHQVLYFSQIESIRAFKAEDPKCNGHQIVSARTGHDYQVLYHFNSEAMRNRLDSYNFAVVLDGLLYRSKALGGDGIAELSDKLFKAGLPPLRSIASIHVMGYGGPGGDYNLQELEEAKKRGITFLYTYARDPHLTVYMDGTDPSKIIETTGPDHGNIYEAATVNKFIPDPQVRSQLGIDQSMTEKRVVAGSTMDFLQSIANMIQAPWPLLIHCKGGRHKTGMFALIFEYLAFKEAMAAEYKAAVSVPLYRNRFARWMDSKGSLGDVFFGGPWFAEFTLHPAEVNYFSHNKSVFRKKNIDFVRGIVSGQYLDTPELRAKWQEIQDTFRAKLREMAPFAIGQY